MEGPWRALIRVASVPIKKHRMGPGTKATLRVQLDQEQPDQFVNENISELYMKVHVYSTPATCTCTC